MWGMAVASITRYKAGWRAQVARDGIRRSKVFETKREAQDWAARQEYLIKNAEKEASAQPFGDVLIRYAREVSPTKRGERWEVLRLKSIAADRLGQVRLRDLTATSLADWRDRRLREVSPSTVRREMNLLGAVLTRARKEWGLLSINPIEDVRRPTEPPPRDRLPTQDEIERLAHVAGDDLSTAQGRTFHAFRFACETAMRAGEIASLEWDRIDLKARVARLPMTKNGHARDVPLSSDAVALLEALPKMSPVFGLTPRQIDALWRKVRGKAAVEGLRFHDSRAFALTRLSAKVDALTLAKISGHRDLSILLNAYYRETAADIAKKLG
ncbi:tyrosine-type recombinase/integrase [Rhodovulum sulfidophilum]|uniref:tyrosine-type recombinase/integrase n=1 Tax=Rhodovulum sulfidophilum TaxID=35806 RepID=UPI001921B7A0|nr:site-specific integrase [Rhodovulum sulfidophilum]MBL3560981.1 site-specific integrase [Rhodovulum sulfidophilum]